MCRPKAESSSECPRHHQWELFSPECATVRPRPLIHDDISTCAVQRGRPPHCVLQEERLLCACDQVGPRKRIWHDFRRFVTTAGRSAEDRTVHIRMSKPESES